MELLETVPATSTGSELPDPGGEQARAGPPLVRGVLAAFLALSGRWGLKHL